MTGDQRRTEECRSEENLTHASKQTTGETSGHHWTCICNFCNWKPWDARTYLQRFFTHYTYLIWEPMIVELHALKICHGTARDMWILPCYLPCKQIWHVQVFSKSHASTGVQFLQKTLNTNWAVMSGVRTLHELNDTSWVLTYVLHESFNIERVFYQH